ncbi:MAG: transpeptidase family protein [Bacteroidia bacterium]|nr:transpeptidase family protein [Bacteroidia bacterium]
MDNRKEILIRVYAVYLLIFLLAGAIGYRIVKLQVVESEKWKEASRQMTYHYKDIDAVRGNIFDINGKLLATSLPYFTLAMDPCADGISAEFFQKNVDSLALCLSAFFGDKSKQEYKRELLNARRNKDRYLVLQKDVSYRDLQEVKKFPIFRRGKYKGGMVYTQVNKRELPFRHLAARTIGYYSENAKPIGIEGAFNNDLRGIGGKRLMKKIAGGVDMPVNDNNEVEPDDGADIVSTIDVNLQDVVENELMTQLIKRKARNGCVILMETQTGEIRAIANLTRKDSSTYTESLNYAIGYATEPGSTFKLASLMAAFEDGFIRPEDEVIVGNGETKFYDLTMKDSHAPKKSKMTIREVFEHSSNVGISKVIWKYYASDQQKFAGRIHAMNLGAPLGLVIPGEADPKVKTVKSKDWSGVTLPFMSIGYETLLTPMQILAFYNAVANNGKMMRPMFVKEIRKRGKPVKVFSPEQIGDKPICSEQTILYAKQLLEGVVENGTGRSLKNNIYRIAGKTGTAQIAQGGKYKKEGVVKYQASFVGYFPADKPKYTCIVVVSAPSNDAYYGAEVAGPIFKSVADKIYSSSLEIHDKVGSNPLLVKSDPPKVKSGRGQDLRLIAHLLNLPVEEQNTAHEWVKTGHKDSALWITGLNVKENLRRGMMPDVSGMGARDAIYLLENAGLVVKISGSGKVTAQSIPSGTRYKKGTVIYLQLKG